MANRGSFAERRRQFRSALASAGGMCPCPKVCCPCCGYPTLFAGNSYEMCALCSWKDDGQDDPEADDVWGGPNGDYSLAEGRARFDETGGRWGMYRPEDADELTTGWPDRKALMDALDAWLAAGEEPRPLAVLERVAQASVDLARSWNIEEIPKIPALPAPPNPALFIDLPDPLSTMVGLAQSNPRCSQVKS